MGLFFRKRKGLGLGLALNFSKSGIGLSMGPKGAKLSLGADGKTRINAGAKGIRYSKTLKSKPEESQQQEPDGKPELIQNKDGTLNCPQCGGNMGKMIKDGIFNPKLYYWCAKCEIKYNIS